MNAQKPPRTPPQKAARPVSARMIAAGVVAVLALVFILQNRDSVAVHIATLTVSAPLWLLLTVMVAVGALVGFLLTRRRG